MQTHGAVLITGEAVQLAPDGRVGFGDGRCLQGDKVLVAAGAWSARLARTLGDRVLLESERGYNTIGRL